MVLKNGVRDEFPAGVEIVSDTIFPAILFPDYALVKSRDASRLSYCEVTNAQHFDGFIDNAAAPGDTITFTNNILTIPD